MTQTTQTMTDRTDTEQGARYGKNESALGTDEADEIVIEIDESQAEDESETDSEPVRRGPEQAVLSSGGGGDGDHADKRAATFERHANGFSYQSHAWGSTFDPTDTESKRYRHLKAVQNTGNWEYGGSGGRHTNEDAKIFRRFRGISQALELPNSIQQRAGRILREIRETPREVCKSWGSELTITACIIEAAEEASYTLSFEEVYEILPKHPDREEEQARHRFEMARSEVQDRHRHRNSSSDDSVINNIRLLGNALDLDDLTIVTAEKLYQTLGDGPTEREESHCYGKTAPVLAAGYVHAVAQKLPDQDQSDLSSSEIAPVLNLTNSPVTATSKAIRESVSTNTLSRGLPAFAGVDSFSHGGMIATSDLIDELQRLSDELGETPTWSEMNKHGKYNPETYRKRFGSWNEALKSAGLGPVKKSNIPEEELVNELQRLADELDKTPIRQEMDDHGKFSSQTYWLRFGSWREAKEVAGV